MGFIQGSFASLNLHGVHPRFHSLQTGPRSPPLRRKLYPFDADGVRQKGTVFGACQVKRSQAKSRPGGVPEPGGAAASLTVGVGKLFTGRPHQPVIVRCSIFFEATNHGLRKEFTTPAIEFLFHRTPRNVSETVSGSFDGSNEIVEYGDQKCD